MQFSAGKVRLRRRKRHRLAETPIDQMIDNCSNTASNFPLKSFNLDQINLTKQNTRTNDSSIPSGVNVMPSRQFFSSNEHRSGTFLKNIQYVNSDQRSFQTSALPDSDNDQDKRQTTSKIETKKGRKLRRIQSVTVTRVTKAEKYQLTNDNQLRKQIGQSKIDITRTLH